MELAFVPDAVRAIRVPVEKEEGNEVY